MNSWGGYPARPQRRKVLASRKAIIEDTDFLPYGLGRSYGDSCLNTSGVLLSSEKLDHFIAFDEQAGVLTCEAGVRFMDVIRYCLPRGWFLPVTPGTQYVTVAGALANDVHGKNHESAGSFGHFVEAFELLRSTGERLICSPDENSEYFHATIGGLGLTGFVTWVRFRLKPVQSQNMLVQSIKYDTLEDFFRLNEESFPQDEYRVAWLDCTTTGKHLGRGHFIRGRHAADHDLTLHDTKEKTFPLRPPISLVNNLSVKAFNALYYARQTQKLKNSQQGYQPFFYPLDGILHWNKMYGKKGFLQHQCVIPKDNARAAIRDLLTEIAKAQTGSFLVVLKMMGATPNRGLLSFPIEGATLAMDFPYQGQKTLDFLHKLDSIVHEAGGRIYPAKDANMRAEHFVEAYPEWEKVQSLKDPAIHSDFWTRVTGMR